MNGKRYSHKNYLIVLAAFFAAFIIPLHSMEKKKLPGKWIKATRFEITSILFSMTTLEGTTGKNVVKIQSILNQQEWTFDFSVNGKQKFSIEAQCPEGSSAPEENGTGQCQCHTTKGSETTYLKILDEKKFKRLKSLNQKGLGKVIINFQKKGSKEKRSLHFINQGIIIVAGSIDGKEFLYVKTPEITISGEIPSPTQK